MPKLIFEATSLDNERVEKLKKASGMSKNRLLSIVLKHGLNHVETNFDVIFGEVAPCSLEHFGKLLRP